MFEYSSHDGAYIFAEHSVALGYIMLGVGKCTTAILPCVRATWGGGFSFVDIESTTPNGYPGTRLSWRLSVLVQKYASDGPVRLAGINYTSSDEKKAR